MKKTFLIAPTVIIVAGVFYYFLSNFKLRRIESNVTQKSEKPLQSVEKVKETVFDMQLDPASIRNLAGTIEWFRDDAMGQRFYKINFTHISAFDVKGERYYFGYIERVSGDGTIDFYPMPAFILKGKLYVSGGSSGNPYPLKETGWVQRYKDNSISTFAPMEKPIYWDTEASLMSVIESGVDNIQLNGNKDGEITRVQFSMGEEVIESKGPFIRVAPFNLVTIPEFENSLSSVYYDEQSRKLSGTVSTTTELFMNNGYKITYPKILNGNQVTVLNESLNNYYFNAGDESTNQDFVSLWCTTSSLEQIGPKKGELLPVRAEDRVSVKDWGYQKRYHADAYSFSGPGFNCQIHTSGTFRPEMFTISF